MKQLLEKIPFLKKKKKGPFAPQIKKVKKQIKGLKIKLFLLYTLPVFVVALAKAVIEEYGRIKVKQAAMQASAELPAEAPNNDNTKSAEQPT